MGNLLSFFLFLVAFCGTLSAETPRKDQGGVLWIGDSMSLCGLGERVAGLMHGEGVEKFPVVHAYMASGTNPMSWLKGPPYDDVGTGSGYWEIHRVGKKVEQQKDVYGMRRGHRPKYHKVPKLEDLLAKHRPEVLVVQMGNCFHDFFPTRSVRVAGRSVSQRYLTKKPMEQVPQYLRAFRRTVAEHGGSVRKLFWIAPASTGTVTDELGDELMKLLEDELPGFEVFDSRGVTKYPYPHMDADGIHFWGNEASDWGDEIYGFIASRLGDREPENASAGRRPIVVRAVTIEEENELKRRLFEARKDALEGESVKLKLKLKVRSALKPPALIYPYRNEMAAFEYEVAEVIKGEFKGDKVRILHPIYLDLELTKASHLEEGEFIAGEFYPLDHTSPWATWPRADDLPDDFRIAYYVAKDDLDEIKRFADR